MKHFQFDLRTPNDLTNELGKTIHAKFCAAILGDTQTERRGDGSQEILPLASDFWLEKI